MSCVAGTCQTTAACVPQGEACAGNADCCAGLACQEGTCQEPVQCVSLGGACTASGLACCTDPGADATCTEGVCQAPVYCQTTLEAERCEFVDGPNVWNCSSLDMSGVNLSGCDLTSASVYNTNASTVAFVSTILTNANFFDGNVTDAEWDNTTCPTGVNSDANSGTCCGEFAYSQTSSGCSAR